MLDILQKLNFISSPILYSSLAQHVVMNKLKTMEKLLKNMEKWIIFMMKFMKSKLSTAAQSELLLWNLKEAAQ